MLRCRAVAAPRASRFSTRTCLHYEPSRPVLGRSCFHSGVATQYATPVDAPLQGEHQHKRPLVKKAAFTKLPDGGKLRRFAEHANKQSLADSQDSNSISSLKHRSSQETGSQGRKSITTNGRACSVLTSTPHSTSLADLLAEVPALYQSNITTSFGLLVFLVTPAYASAARNHQSLFEQAMKRIYPDSVRKAQVAHGLHTLVAVVDRLPRPSASANDGGSEGLAFMFTDDVADVSDLFLRRTQEPSESVRDIASSLQVRRSLTFDILTERTYEGHAAEQNNLTGSVSRSYSVQVPLSNTIFQNGLHTTLIHSRYDNAGTDQWVKTSSRHLNTQTLRLPFFAADEKGSNLSLTAPLVPLTTARSVVASMGNIVRRFAAGSQTPSKTSTDNTILASQELEDSVQSYFKARGIPPQQVSVWALIVPKEAFSAHSTSMIDVLQPQNLVQRWANNTLDWIQSAAHTPLSLLQHRVRLHKVLSGGGGWGKKAGLLSLDPDSSYSPDAPLNQDTPFFAGFELEMEDRDSALKDIVSPGDYIQFYTSPSVSSIPSQDTQTKDRDSQIRSAAFGSIPSTIDAMPKAVEITASGTGLQVYPNHFGALSEVGIALTINQHDLRDRQHVVEVLNQTKIDVPFGRFSLLSTEDSKDVASSQAGEPNRKMDRLWKMFQDNGGPPRDDEKRASNQSQLNLYPTKPLRSDLSKHHSPGTADRLSGSDNVGRNLAQDESHDWFQSMMDGRKRNRDQKRAAKRLRKARQELDVPSSPPTPASGGQSTIGQTIQPHTPGSVPTPAPCDASTTGTEEHHNRGSSIRSAVNKFRQEKSNNSDELFSWLKAMDKSRKRSQKRMRSAKNVDPITTPAPLKKYEWREQQQQLLKRYKDKRLRKLAARKHEKNRLKLKVRRTRISERVQSSTRTKQRSRARFLHSRRAEAKELEEIGKHKIWQEVMRAMSSKQPPSRLGKPASTLTDMKRQRRSIKSDLEGRQVEESVRLLFNSGKR